MLAVVAIVAGLIFMQRSTEIQIWMLLPALILTAVVYEVRGAATGLAMCSIIAWLAYDRGLTPDPISGEGAMSAGSASTVDSSVMPRAALRARHVSRKTRCAMPKSQERSRSAERTVQSLSAEELAVLLTPQQRERLLAVLLYDQAKGALT